MSAVPSERVDAAVSYSRLDEAAVEPILASLRAEGLSIWFDKDIPGGAMWEEIIARKYRASGALLFFVSKASLASERCSEEVSTARTLGKPIIPVLLEPLKLPEDLPDRFVLTLQARNTVDVYGKTDEDKRRNILRALAAFGIAGAGAGVADAGSISAAEAPEAATASSSSSAPAARLDPLAKTNISVSKASSAFSTKAIAFGGAAVATALVVGAVVLLQTDKAPPAAPAENIAAAETSSSAASSAPVTAPAATEPGDPAASSPAPANLETGGAIIRLAQSSYAAGKAIPIRVEGMPGDQNDYVAIALAGSPGFGPLRYAYLNGKKDSDLVLPGIMKPGAYEVRLFFGADQKGGKSERIRFSTPLTITPAAPIRLNPEATSVPEGRAIRVAFDGLPGNKNDWIATARADSSDGSHVAYVYTDGATAGTVDLPPLATAGRYEIRVYFDDLTSDRTVQARIPIEVTPAPPVNLGLDGLVYEPGQEIVVSFNAMPGNATDWLALGREGDDGYLTYKYTGGKTSGFETFNAPEEPGAYEVRAYFNDARGDKTVRAAIAFEVSDAGANEETVTAPDGEPLPEAEPEALPEEEVDPEADPTP